MKIIFLLMTFIFLSNGKKLLGVVEFFRHGSRGPIQQDSLNPHKWENWQLGQLTPAGYRMHFLIGHEIRRRYVKSGENDTNPLHILPTNFIDSNIEIHSDNYPRCILSAQSQLAGLYPIGTGPKLQNKAQQKAGPPFHVPNKKEIQETLKEKALPLLINLVPVHITDNDSLTINTLGLCGRTKEIISIFNESEENKEWIQTNYVDSGFQEQLSRVFLKTGLIEIDDAYWLYDWVEISKTEGYELPEELTDEIFQKLHDLSTYNFFTKLSPTDESVSLQSSLFLQETLNYFEGLIKKTTQVKMKLWSGHDTGVAPIVKALKLEPKSQIYQSPPFASNIFIELYETDEGHNVIFKYQDIERNSSLCGAQTCTFTQFKDQVSKFLIPDVNSICQVQVPITSVHFEVALSGVAIIALLLGIEIKKKQ